MSKKNAQSFKPSSKTSLVIESIEPMILMSASCAKVADIADPGTDSVSNDQTNASTTNSSTTNTSTTDASTFASAPTNSGASSLDGTSGNDLLSGGPGNDTINGGLGSDLLIGNGGDDTLLGNEGHDLLTGGAGNDRLDGGDGDDILKGEAGDDTLFGGNGNNIIDGGEGVDTAFFNGKFVDFQVTDLGGGTVQLRGTESIDVISNVEEFTFTDGTVTLADLLGGRGPTSTNVINGTDGNDNLTGTAGDDRILGGKGDDLLQGGAGDTGAGDTGVGAGTIVGTDGDDKLIGTSGDDAILAGAGNDTIDGRSGNDVIDGGDGIDTVFFKELTTITDVGNGELVVETPDGTSRLKNVENVSISGEVFPVSLFTGGSDNSGDAGACDAGADDAGAGDAGAGANDVDKDQVLTGTNGKDVLVGGNGNDVVNGGKGNDALSGGDGNDRLIGGKGNDRIDGGEGIDVAAFRHVKSVNRLSNGNILVISADGKDEISNVEIIESNGRQFSIDEALKKFAPQNKMQVVKSVLLAPAKIVSHVVTAPFKQLRWW